MAIMDTLKNKKRQFFYSRRGNLDAGPSEDEGTVCRKDYRLEKKPRAEQRHWDYQDKFALPAKASQD